MIFITVGTQAPFDRLIELVDQWACHSNMKCFAQTNKGKYIPKNIEHKEFLTEQEFNAHFNEAKIIISHAGMGTIISSLKNGKILLTLPRLAEFKEHRNDHQYATTKAFAQKEYIYPIYNESDLLKHLNKLSQLKCLKQIGDHADDDLLAFIKNI
ncbi:glycosyltransferase [Mangrovibacterium lignilyticum]|uniref:glycosyltransferase n=1 Tax=Mangrovibacterium lignilyticum TaxID=2668052 RepID=UPI0013D5BB19|nr:glycosyltransferase [Mangrovibacterium lignilyticum]